MQSTISYLNETVIFSFSVPISILYCTTMTAFPFLFPCPFMIFVVIMLMNIALFLISYSIIFNFCLSEKKIFFF